MSGVSGADASAVKAGMMLNTKQTTIRSRIDLAGFGVHSGKPAAISLHPANAETGISFLRTGLEGGRTRRIRADWSAVSATELCTVLGDETASVSTIEHLMAALYATGIDNVLVEIDGPEVPIMDGSSEPFMDAIEAAGIVRFNAPRKYLRVLKPVRIEQGRGWAELLPYDRGFRLEVEIDFDTALIGRQKKVFELDARGFRRELSRARTFGFMRDVEYLWKAGFALGASLDNTVALGDDGILNPEGLRYPDEFVRHKTLDAVGDLSLAGAPLLAHYRSYCGGHRMNVSMLEALFADASNYEIVDPARVFASSTSEAHGSAAAIACAGEG